MKQYIIFNNLCSMDVEGFSIEQFLPGLDTPTRRVIKTPVAGRSGDLRILESQYGEDVYETLEKPIGFSYKGDNINLVKKWLRGDGKLLLSNNPDRYWKASIDNTIPITTLLNSKLRNFTVVFACFPFAFLTIGDTPIVYNPASTIWETIIMNDYDLSLPHLKIYGQGNIGLLINGIETDFYSVDGYIECDSDLQQCYKGTQNLGSNMSGQFPVLYSGKNTIVFTGNISKVVLNPHWRTL